MRGQESLSELKQDKSTILVVEDVEVNMVLVKALISKFLPNSVVHEAVDGLDAIQKVKKNRPDLILMDVQMPNMDGYEATKKILEMDDGIYSSIPIIALTAHAFKGEQEKCMNAGMVDYITKPIDSETLTKVVSNYLKTSLDDKSISLKGANQQKTYSLIDTEQLLEMLYGDEATMTELLSLANRDLKLLNTKLSEAYLNSDHVQIAHALHKLKGMLASIKSKVGIDLIIALEEDNEIGDERLASQSKMDELNKELGQLIDELSMVLD
jgi:CheY-like chemotaxis protein